MAENFNEYFVKIGPTLAGNIQPIDGDHLAYITNRPADSMFIALTDEHEIQSIVQVLIILIIITGTIYIAPYAWALLKTRALLHTN